MQIEIIQQDKLIYNKLIDLCRYIYGSISHQKLFIFKQAQTFGVPCRTYQTKEKIVFTVANALANLLLEEKHGLQIAAIFLK